MLDELKVTITGSSGIGKTQFVNELNTDTFDYKYIPTLGVEVFPYKTEDTIYNIWDTGGQENFSELLNSYLINSDIIIMMCDSQCKISQKEIKDFFISAYNAAPNAKFCICISKYDLGLENKRYDYIKNIKHKIEKKLKRNITITPYSARTKFFRSAKEVLKLANSE